MSTLHSVGFAFLIGAGTVAAFEAQDDTVEVTRYELRFSYRANEPTQGSLYDSRAEAEEHAGTLRQSRGPNGERLYFNVSVTPVTVRERRVTPPPKKPQAQDETKDRSRGKPGDTSARRKSDKELEEAMGNAKKAAKSAQMTATNSLRNTIEAQSSGQVSPVPATNTSKGRAESTPDERTKFLRDQRIALVEKLRDPLMSPERKSDIKRRIADIETRVREIETERPEGAPAAKKIRGDENVKRKLEQPPAKKKEEALPRPSQSLVEINARPAKDDGQSLVGTSWEDFYDGRPSIVKDYGNIKVLGLRFGSAGKVTRNAGDTVLETWEWDRTGDSVRIYTQGSYGRFLWQTLAIAGDRMYSPNNPKWQFRKVH